MRKILLTLVYLLILACAAWAATASPAKSPQFAKDKTMRTLDINAWKIYTTNYGLFVSPHGPQLGGCWGGPVYNYIYCAGLWVGGIDTLDTARVSMGCNYGGGSEMGPVDPNTFSYSNWSTNHRARYYLSTDPADLAEWPVKDADGNNIIKSMQDGYGVYSDQNPAFTFTDEKPLGVGIRQWSYAWNYADNNDIGRSPDSRSVPSETRPQGQGPPHGHQIRVM